MNGLTKHNGLFKWERVWRICLFWSGQEVLLQTLQEQGLWKKSMSYLLMFSRSVESDSAIPRTAACQASLSITISQSFRKLLSIESVMPSNHLILCRSVLLLPSIFPSIRVFSNESSLHIRWPKYWSFSFTISLSNEYSGLISFRVDWLDLLVAQGSLKSLLQHHSSKALIVQHSSFFTLAWKIPWMEEPGGLQSMGSLRVGHDSDFTFTFHFHALEKEMTTHSSVLAWRIPGMGEPVGCRLWGCTESDMTEAT